MKLTIASNEFESTLLLLLFQATSVFCLPQSLYCSPFLSVFIWPTASFPSHSLSLLLCLSKSSTPKPPRPPLYVCCSPTLPYSIPCCFYSFLLISHPCGYSGMKQRCPLSRKAHFPMGQRE